jgi:hypothetical protein
MSDDLAEVYRREVGRCTATLVTTNPAERDFLATQRAAVDRPRSS